MAENIYPIYDRMMTRQDKESLLGQRGIMIWFTGLSGSGKTTDFVDGCELQDEPACRSHLPSGLRQP